MIIFIIESSWLALCAAYPMAFDEQFHFGLIQLHAQQWLPFFTHQPSTGQYGAVVRDPSYLYHWLMSYPLRLTLLFTHDQTIQIIVLRFINLGLFVLGLILYRRLLRRMGLSAALTNTSLLAFVLIPTVPFLAATINYDNLLVVLVPMVLLMTFDVMDALRRHRVPLARLVILLSALLLGSLVKYPFLPVFVVIGAFILYYSWRSQVYRKKIWYTAWVELRTLAWAKQALLIVLLVVSMGLFSERYVVNLIQYHTPVPSCSQVVSGEVCMQYSPWARDEVYKAGKPTNFHPEPLKYVGSWLHGMWYRLFFAITSTYSNYPPLYLVSRVAIVVAALLALGIAIRFTWLFRGHPERVLLLLLLLGYGLALFADNYHEYTQTAELVAINGRYWIPFMPLFFVLGGLVWSYILRRMPVTRAGVVMIFLAVFLFQGGGAMTYIVRSDDSWYWPNATVRRVNGDIRSVVSPTVFGKDLPH